MYAQVGLILSEEPAVLGFQIEGLQGKEVWESLILSRPGAKPACYHIRETNTASSSHAPALTILPFHPPKTCLGISCDSFGFCCRLVGVLVWFGLVFTFQGVGASKLCGVPCSAVDGDKS